MMSVGGCFSRNQVCTLGYRGRRSDRRTSDGPPPPGCVIRRQVDSDKPLYCRTHTRNGNTQSSSNQSRWPISSPSFGIGYLFPKAYSFEAPFLLRQFGRKTRRSGMHLGADMVGDETHDALAVFRRQSLPGVVEAS